MFTSVSDCQRYIQITNQSGYQNMFLSIRPHLTFDKFYKIYGFYPILSNRRNISYLTVKNFVPYPTYDLLLTSDNIVF